MENEEYGHVITYHINVQQMETIESKVLEIMMIEIKYLKVRIFKPF